MSNPANKGQAAFFRMIKETGQDYAFDCEKAERLANKDEGTYPSEVILEMMADPKWQPPVDMEEEDAALELDKLIKSETGCALDRSVAWVAENLGNERARFQDAPSRTAFNILKWADDSAANKSEFIKNLLSKLMPSSKELDNQARYSDDGSKQIELAERILTRMAENAA